MTKEEQAVIAAAQHWAGYYYDHLHSTGSANARMNLKIAVDTLNCALPAPEPAPPPATPHVFTNADIGKQVRTTGASPISTIIGFKVCALDSYGRTRLYDPVDCTLVNPVEEKAEELWKVYVGGRVGFLPWEKLATANRQPWLDIAKHVLASTPK
jgi:hypothetical protein